MKALNIRFAPFLALSLSSCISLFPEQGPAPQEILLQSSGAMSVPEVTHRSHKHILSVGDPQSPAHLKLKSIALERLQGGARVLDHVAGVQWHGAPMALLQREMMTHFIGLGIFKGVVGEGSPLASDMRLETFVDDLSVDLTGQPAKARLRITAILNENNGQGRLKQKVFQFETNVTSQTPGAIQESFKDLLDQYLRALGEWVMG